MSRPPLSDAEKPEDGERNADDRDEQTEANAQHQIGSDKRIEARTDGGSGAGWIHGSAAEKVNVRHFARNRKGVARLATGSLQFKLTGKIAG